MKKRGHLVSALHPGHVSVFVSSVSTIILWKDLVLPILWLRRQVQRFKRTLQPLRSRAGIWARRSVTPKLVSFAPRSTAPNMASGLRWGYGEESQYHSQKQGNWRGGKHVSGPGNDKLVRGEVARVYTNFLNIWSLGLAMPIWAAEVMRPVPAPQG